MVKYQHSKIELTIPMMDIS